MKKNNLVFIIIALIVIGGIVFFVKNKPATKTNQEVVPPTEKTQEKKTSVFESIKDAMAKSLSFKCEYSTNNNKTVAYVKGTSMRIDGFITGKATGTIIKNNKLWSWDMDKKEGIIMPLDMNKDQELSQEKMVENLEKEKQFCQVTVVSDSVFNPPADVKFQDLSKLFEKISNMPTK